MSKKTQRLISVTGIGFLVAAAIYLDSDRRNKASLWETGIVLLQHAKTDSILIRVKELFGDDVQGVCVITWGAPTTGDSLIARSPREFESAIREIQTLNPQSALGPSRWFLYTVRNGRTHRKYELFFGGNLQILPADAASTDQDGCYGANAPLRIELYSIDDDRKMGLRFYRSVGGMVK